MRDTGATQTIGGGVVLDPFPPRRGRRTPQRLAQLDALQADDAGEALRRLLAVAPGWTDQAAFMRARNVPADRRAEVIASASAIPAGDLVLSAAAFDADSRPRCCRRSRPTIGSPELPGLQPDRLRLALADRPPLQGFAGILEALRGDGRSGAGWALVQAARPSRQPVASGRETMARRPATDRSGAVPAARDAVDIASHAERSRRPRHGPP